MMRRAEIAQPRVPVCPYGLGQRCAQARLADPRLAGDQHDASFAAFRLLPAALQQIELLVAPDQWCGLRTQCLEAADDHAFACHTPGTLRLGKTG